MFTKIAFLSVMLICTSTLVSADTSTTLTPPTVSLLDGAWEQVVTKTIEKIPLWTTSIKGMNPITIGSTSKPTIDSVDSVTGTPGSYTIKGHTHDYDAKRPDIPGTTFSVTLSQLEPLHPVE